MFRFLGKVTKSLDLFTDDDNQISILERPYILFFFASISEAFRPERKHIPGGTILLRRLVLESWLARDGRLYARRTRMSIYLLLDLPCID